jgi:Mn-dependent DtxR family transcriptional regulator
LKGKLRSKDVAHLLDVDPDSVMQLARKGLLKGEKIGRIWFFSLEDVQAYQRRQGQEKKAKE